MRYATAIDRLYDLDRHAMEPGIERTEALLESLGDPQTGYDAVQIAGTNGKGATATTLASILRRAGYRVGLYLSPHLERLNERITVDGRPISNAGVARFVDAVVDRLDEAGAAGAGPTFFEATTAMALWQFAEQEVDIAVLEVGLGGRHDATSVVDPVAAAVTSVGLDHTDVLGSTIEEIAADKCAIADGEIPFVTASHGPSRTAVLGERPEATVVGTDSAADVRVDYDGIDSHLEAGLTVTGPDWSVDTHTPLLGERQAVNAALAATLARGRWAVDESTIAAGIRGVEYPGRAEVVQRAPLVVLDGAHNEPAAAHLSSILAALPGEAIHLVIGVMADKDLPGIVDALPSPASVTACRPDTPRAASPRTIARAFEAAGIDSVDRHRSVEAAVTRAIERAAPDELICVTGSLYTVAEARQRWTRTPAVARFETVDGVERALGRAAVSPNEIDRLSRSGVHRSVRVRVRRSQGRALARAIRDAGGRCAISEPTADGELVEVVLFGTLATFDAAIETLEAVPGGGTLAAQLATSLDRSHGPSWASRPWAGDTTAVMGIVNATPDSFYDGGEATTVEAALERATQQVDAGADIIDIGGESTRPGGEAIPTSTEHERVVPVIEAVSELDVLVSIDTQKAAVAAAAVDAGADIVNDVSGLADPAMAPTVADLEVPIVVMHSHSTPVEPDLPIEYDDVVTDVRRRLGELVRRCERAGIDRSDVIVDPGIGFNKTPRESFELIARTRELRALGCPVLIGHSQKSMFGSLGYEVDERNAPTVATSAIAATRGADILRVHHVGETVAAVRASHALTRID